MQLPPPSPADVERAKKIERRAADWRFGPVVYQVFVDRFAPSDHLDAKRSLYAKPRKLKDWSDLPGPGTFQKTSGYYSHEVEFWGGDLPSVTGKLDYVHGLGADVLYLTPIFAALTNHKYDTEDYRKIAPEFGTEQDFDKLLDQTHRRGMKLMLDGVFNHIGRSSAPFQAALKSPTDPHRDWFFFDPKYPNGYLGYAGSANLPELRMESASVRRELWNGPDSVVRHYLKKGIDGWRLDVAFELGLNVLHEITSVAHQEKPGSAVVGEASGYPSDWFGSLDGLFNFMSPAVVVSALRGELTGGEAGRVLSTVVEDAGIENLLKSWILLDNHDTDRLATQLPDFKLRRLAMAALTTLPGAPVIYYGSEVGMMGQGDPRDRAPMRWDLVKKGNPDLDWTRKLLSIRKAHPALRYGDFATLPSRQLLAYQRTTHRLRDAMVVVINPTDSEVKEVLPVRVGRIQSWGKLGDLISGEQVRVINGLMHVSVPSHEVRIFAPIIDPSPSSPYRRIP